MPTAFSLLRSVEVPMLIPQSSPGKTRPSGQDKLMSSKGRKADEQLQGPNPKAQRIDEGGFASDFERKTLDYLDAIARHLEIKVPISKIKPDQVHKELRHIQSLRRPLEDGDPCEYDLGTYGDAGPCAYTWTPRSEVAQADDYMVHLNQWASNLGLGAVRADGNEHFLSVDSSESGLHYSYSGTTDVILYDKASDVGSTTELSDAHHILDQVTAQQSVRVVLQAKKTLSTRLHQSLRQAIIELICADAKVATQPVLAVLTDFQTYHFLWLDAQAKGICRVCVRNSYGALEFLGKMVEGAVGGFKMDKVNAHAVQPPTYGHPTPSAAWQWLAGRQMTEDAVKATMKQLGVTSE